MLNSSPLKEVCVTFQKFAVSVLSAAALFSGVCLGQSTLGNLVGQVQDQPELPRTQVT